MAEHTVETDGFVTITTGHLAWLRAKASTPKPDAAEIEHRGHEGGPATVIGGWTVLGVNSHPAGRWVSLRHDSGAMVTMPWDAVISTPPATTEAE